MKKFDFLINTNRRLANFSFLVGCILMLNVISHVAPATPLKGRSAAAKLVGLAEGSRPISRTSTRAKALRVVVFYETRGSVLTWAWPKTLRTFLTRVKAQRVEVLYETRGSVLTGACPRKTRSCASKRGTSPKISSIFVATLQFNGG